MESNPYMFPQAQSTHTILDTALQELDPKYRKAMLDDQGQIHFTPGVVNLHKFITLINDS